MQNRESDGVTPNANGEPKPYLRPQQTNISVNTWNQEQPKCPKYRAKSMVK